MAAVVQAMAVDASGKSTLLCRYVGASWELPDGYDQGDRETIMQRLSRLVAQVPYLQDNDMRRSRHDVWTRWGSL